MEATPPQNKAVTQNQQRLAEQHQTSSDSGQQIISLQSDEDAKQRQDLIVNVEPRKQQDNLQKLQDSSAQLSNKTLDTKLGEHQLPLQKRSNILPKQASFKNVRKYEGSKNAEDDDEWKLEAQSSDYNGQENKFYIEEQEQQHEITAVYDEEVQQNMEIKSQLNISSLNQGFLQKEVSMKYDHLVENKHLLVLYFLFRDEIYNKLFPKLKYNQIDIHPSNKNKIKIFGTSNEEIKEISLKISELINQISIIKLNIRNQQCYKMKSSQSLNKKLLKDKIVIFKYGNINDKSYYLGGKGSQPFLNSYFKEIRNLRFRYFRMFDYANTRSYRIILNYIIQQKQCLKFFNKWSLKNLQIVDFIPNFGSNFQNKYQKQKQKSMCILMTTVGNLENFSPKQLQNEISSFIQNSFYSIVLIFKQGEKYLPKLTVQGITFKYITERKFNRSYVYIICLKNNFFEKRQQIIKQLEKLQMNNKIYGARYFKRISPQYSQYIKPEKYKVMVYPLNRPYSFSVVPKIIKNQVKEQDAGKINESILSEEKNEMQNGEIQNIQDEKKEWNFYTFDWKEHLRNINLSQVSFIEEKNN